MAKIGYARVSTRSQNDDSQIDELTAYGCGKIFTDTASGKLAARPELDKALACLREGDVLVITRLSRAMRSLKHLFALADQLRERGAGLVVLKQQIDTTTPAGRLVFHILGAIDEFQRELIIEGTREGLDAARARGRARGRKPKLNARQAATVRRMYQAAGPDDKRLRKLAATMAWLIRTLARDTSLWADDVWVVDSPGGMRPVESWQVVHEQQPDASYGITGTHDFLANARHVISGQ
jgi:DNA invertase Pin-like site-specific DNA recombinase